MPGYSTEWFAIQRVGLTEEEDEYLQELQELLGLRYRHEALRVIIKNHMENLPNRDPRRKGLQAKPKAG